MKKLKNIQENSERQFTELMNKISEQKQHFTKEIETVKKSQTNPGVKNSVDGMGSALESIGGGAVQMEERVW